MNNTHNKEALFGRDRDKRNLVEEKIIIRNKVTHFDDSQIK